MGKIYQRAQHVIGWLGDDRDLSNLFRLLNFLQENKIVLTGSLVGRCDIAELDRFVKNEYWLRAWIT
jgi:hypothetical protein